MKKMIYILFGIVVIGLVGVFAYRSMRGSKGLSLPETAAYDVPVHFRENVPINFPDFTLTFLGMRDSTMNGEPITIPTFQIASMGGMKEIEPEPSSAGLMPVPNFSIFSQKGLYHIALSGKYINTNIFTDPFAAGLSGDTLLVHKTE